MNRKILQYVNYLLDNDPSPFCDYLICKELLELDDKTVRGSYDWAVQFKLYSELRDEQMPDGSWGGFEDMITEQAKRKHFKTTARAMYRMIDLSLDISDPMVLSAVELCRKYASGEKPFPNTWGEKQLGQADRDAPLRRAVAVVFCPRRYKCGKTARIIRRAAKNRLQIGVF